ncbi:hypothetical protein ACJX0J_007324, partial [Zea mays]
TLNNALLLFAFEQASGLKINFHKSENSLDTCQMGYSMFWEDTWLDGSSLRDQYPSFLICVFCHKKETINHLFFECLLAQSVWSFTTHIQHRTKTDTITDSQLKVHNHFIVHNIIPEVSLYG